MLVPTGYNSDIPFYYIFAPQQVPLLEISDDVIASDLWFPTPQSKILATSMLEGPSIFFEKRGQILFKRERLVALPVIEGGYNKEVRFKVVFSRFPL